MCVPGGGACCACGSVKIGRQLGVEAVLVQARDLRGEDSPGGELGERLHGEELYGVGLAAHRGLPAQPLAEEEELVDVVDAGRVWMAALVEQGGELHGPGPVAGLLEDLAGDRAGGGVVDVGPAAGKGPSAVGALSDEQDWLALEDPAAHVHFGGCVAFIAFPEAFCLG